MPLALPTPAGVQFAPVKVNETLKIFFPEALGAAVPLMAQLVEVPEMEPVADRVRVTGAPP